ncbi:MAG: ankyrin repeat domain-containing protein, partial [Planctomycetes bacterium]|nr:ankyrin repeat domain-containing protein [Planctomycetota bacterium]
VAAGADVTRPAVGNALVSACLAGHAGVVERLEAAGASSPGLAAARTIQAVREGDVSALRALLAAGHDASAVDPTDPRTPSALHLAAAGGNVEVSRALLEAGAQVDAVTSSAVAPWGRTPLMVAAAAGYGEVVGLLLEHGANPQTQDRDYEEGERTALMLAAAGGNVTTVRILLKGGADPNVKDQEGLTALMHAALSGEAASLRLLLAAGARIDARCALGQTALIYAAQEGNLEAVETLLDSGADVGTLPPEGWSALAAAVYGGHMDVVSLLIDAGADLDEGERDQPPLALAVTEGHVDVLGALLDAGADPDATAAGGLTALMLCALGEHSALADSLLQAGADVDARDGEEQTALMLAAHHGRLGLVETLLEAGADPRLTDREGLSAREHAERGEQPAVLALLASYGVEAARPAVRQPSDAARVDPLRGMADYFGEGRALLVRAPLARVADALAVHRGWRRQPDVLGETRELPARCLRLTAYADLPWAVVQAESALTTGALGESDAATLSATLGCEAVFLANSDEAGTLVFRHFRAGQLVERLDYDSGADEDVDETRYWRAGSARPVEIDDPYDFTDARLRALEAYVPASLPPGEAGQRRHVAGEAGATRADWVSA